MADNETGELRLRYGDLYIVARPTSRGSWTVDVTDAWGRASETEDAIEALHFLLASIGTLRGKVFQTIRRKNMSDGSSDRTPLQEAIDLIMSAALRVIQDDPHQWSSRPCTSCRVVSRLVGKSFGCVLYAEKKAQETAETTGGE